MQEPRKKRQDMRPHEIAAEARDIHARRARGDITPEDAEQMLSDLLLDTHTPFIRRIFGY